jgi:predicted enzyme related to lactoylglutathione lyase
MAPPKLRSLTPLAQVADVARSIRFYELLGFTVRNTFTPEDNTTATWAWLTSDGADLMVGQAEVPLAARHQPVLFYLYCDDVDGMYAHLKTVGIEVGPITKPFYAPRGEFGVTDPDGYVIMVTHT